MASLNVAEWTPDQVAEWLSGLGPTVARYAPVLRARGLDGRKLLMLRCDDLEYLGMHVIGHQELLLEAVEHLRNFQYESRRECVQQLAARVSGAATGLARALARALRRAPDARLDTQALADVAATVRAVKPLVCWLDRWPLVGSGGAGVLGERKAQLLQLSLEAATCAQRDRFAEQPARAVAAAAAAAAAAADYIVQEVSDPMILQPASLDTVTLRQGEKPLGFNVVPSFCGHHQLCDIRFGSPAHASGAVHDGDEIVQVGPACVIGWSGEAVEARCAAAAAAAGGELQLRLRRRAARAPAALATPQLHRARYRHNLDLRLDTIMTIPEAEATAATVPTDAEEAPHSPASSSDESEPLSPPASPDHLHLPHTRMYPPKPRSAVQRRHTISCGSPLSKRPNLPIDQFWRQLREHKWERGDSSDHDDSTLYRRDKAVSYSTGLELSPRPRTCLGVLRDRDDAPRSPPAAPAGNTIGAGKCGRLPNAANSTSRGRLDKSHSTPAYDFGEPGAPGPLVAQVIPESPTAHTPQDSPTILVHSAEKADQILDFKKSSSQIGEAILQQAAARRGADEPPGPDERLELGARERLAADKERILETINIAMMEHRRRSTMGRAGETERLELLGGDRAGEEPPSPPSSGDERRIPPRWARSERAPSPPPRPAARALPGGAGSAAAGAPAYPVLRAVARVPDAPPAPARQPRPLHASQISLPLRHITKHDIKVIPSERRELPAINAEAEAPASPAPPAPDARPARKDSADSEGRGLTLSPSAAAVKSIFPSSKSRSLKKKNSILAKRRCVAARALLAGNASGEVWQRVRPRHAQQPRWARRYLLLAHTALYAYRTQDCNKADCMIYLEGFTVCAAGEVKSRAHCFKVYHTGTAFYFACDSRDNMLAWIHLIHRATLHTPSSTQSDISKQFSETDYSDTESDTDSPEKRSERERERERRDEKDKDKSKFGSLKKLTGRVQRSESQENVSHASTSLDRKYLRFFSRNKSKDDNKNSKNKQSGVPVPTEHYRSYRRVTHSSNADSPAAPSSPDTPALTPSHPPPAAKIPKPINYIHASNPNLLDFEKSDFVTKPTLRVPKPRPKPEPSPMGLVTLEEFMLKKQAEERKQVYTNRVLLGIERDRPARDLQHRLDRIVPDVIYGELPSCTHMQGRSLPRTPAAPAPERPAHSPPGKPISVKGKDGYEKLVYPSEAAALGYESVDEPAQQHERWRDSLRRNDKNVTMNVNMSSWSGNNGTGSGVETTGGPGVSRLRLVFRHARQSPPTARADPSRGGGAGAWGVYPHLQCPPTFQPESYSLARLAPAPPHPPPPPHAPPPQREPRDS
ncbi:hypothetical protein ABMA28_015313 [Loxostege sticticalis]|uniref:Connector enhancer of kinase suppressor of ras 2 n=1 Tax=Loxostege sticticalis TaxID=481309 RepID=A0ABD0TBF3_LOXSC